MSKKSRRQRRPNLPPEAFNSPSAAIAAPAVRAAATATAAAPRKLLEINWQEEYSEVLGDLRRTAILAVIMIVAMGVLSIVIH
jgi:hypothetical protein